MRVAIQQSFAASRKEPLAEMLDRVHQAFITAGITPSTIRFNFGDSPIPRGISSVDRVLKRYPYLEKFVTTAPPAPGHPGARRISNGPMSAGAGESVEYEILRAIAAGVPRSFPFNSVVFHYYSPEFGELPPPTTLTSMLVAGIVISDSWWVNGRNRSLSACTLLEVEASSKKIPALAPPIAAILAACGKVRRTVQIPLADYDEKDLLGVRAPSGIVVPSARPQAVRAVHEIVTSYKGRMPEILEKAALPHALPPPDQALRQTPLDVTSGPRKPALESAFKSLGYSCQGGSGTFTLRRRTAANLTLEVHLDVGTWGHKVIGMYRVLGLGFKGLLPLPVAADAVVHSQYPIGVAEQWRKIVENLAVLVAYYERTVVPEIEADAGPSPEWYRPDQ